MSEEKGNSGLPRLLGGEERAARARALSDDQLVHYQQLLQDGRVEDNLWLPVLDAEFANRGLRRRPGAIKRR